jgi:hypothetical protein
MNRAWLISAATLLALGLAAAPCGAQLWLPSGIAVCQNGCPGYIPQVVPDGQGGVFVAWRDPRNHGDIYLQRITALGLIAPGWPPDGLPIVVDPSTQQFSDLAPDGLGGALVAWEDWRNLSPTGEDPEVQRVLANGSLAPGWPPDGARISAPRFQCSPQVAPDGLGGAYVAWADCNDVTPKIYGQHLTASGSVAPGWPEGGLALCAAPGNQGGIYFAMPDDSGGAVFEWGDGRPGAPGGYALRVHADGTLAPGWPEDGLLLTSRGNRAVIRDEAGGFFTVSPTPGEIPGFDGAFYLLRFTFGGTPAPGWPAGGVLVCNAPGIRAGVTIDSDGAGGALLSWYDYRLVCGGIFAVRVLSDGTLAPGWTVDGTLVSDPSNGLCKYDPFVVRDGQGGGYIVWQSQGASDVPSWIQHLTGSGQVAAGWPQYGLRVAPSYDQVHTRITTDGQGGAIVVWDEGCCGRVGVWAQRFAPDGPTPVLLSLVSAEAKDGLVQLDWYSPDAAALNASVYRRTEISGWESLGGVMGDGTGHLRYQDRAVSPGNRYAYRLGYEDQGLEHFSAETWVDVPALELALEGLRPNPAAGDLMASFTLPSAVPAQLQLLDVTGRVVLAREVGSLGAGNHVVRLSGKASVPAGMYWLKLTQSGRSLLARGVVLQ